MAHELLRKYRFLYPIFLILVKCVRATREIINLIILPYFILKNNKIFEELIRNKRVLLLASAPSANDIKLEDIPEDVKILTCKAAPRLFLDKKYHRDIDLYMVYGGKMKQDPSLIELLKKIKTKVFVIDDRRYMEKKKELKNFYSVMIWDRNDNNYYLKKLIQPYTFRSIIGTSLPRTSTGMRLLQYALYFGAKEIYLAGIDISEGGYFWGEKNVHHHLDIDNNFMKIVSKKYDNIYSLSKNSPITQYIPFKTFDKKD